VARLEFPLLSADVFLEDPPPSKEVESEFAADREEDGYVNNLTRLWAWRPGLFDGLRALRTGLMDSSALTDRDWAVLTTATVSQSNDSYCALAWGARLTELSDAETAAQVLSGLPASALSERESALAEWARKVVRDPNATTSDDVARLREVGLGDREIFEATAYIAFRIALATVNDALGAAPDKQLADAAPEPVRRAVTYGRAPSREPSPA
jgi:uncharacterized peroxidase-related enzyme